MTKVFVTMLLTFLLSSTAWAQLTEINSLPKAALEIHAMNAPAQTTGDIETPYTHDVEKNNSLARGALAKQGVKVSLRINADSTINYTRNKDVSERYNSFYRGVLAQ